MKIGLYSIITLFALFTLIAPPNSFAQEALNQPSVRLIYFLPNDRPAHPDRIEALQQLIKDAQEFYADEMERHGYGRKTFRVETDTDGTPVVHQFDGKFAEEHYYNFTGYRVWKEIYEHFGDLQNIHFVAIDMSSEILNGGYSCGEANVNFFPSNGGIVQRRDSNMTQGKSAGGFALIPASGDCFQKLGLTAHELGHAFGLQHDFREGIDTNYVMAYGNQDQFSMCAAEWLSVSPFFNTNSSIHNAHGAIQFISPPMYSPDGVKLRFEVTDTDGLHQAQLLVVEIVGGGGSVGTYRDYRLFDYKKVNGETSTIEFISQELPVNPVDRIGLQIIDVNGSFTWATFLVDIASELPPPEIVSIPDPKLAAAVRHELRLDASIPITRWVMKRLTTLHAPKQQIKHLKGLEHATGLVRLDLWENQIQNVRPLSNLKQLQQLHLQANRIRNIKAFAGLTELRQLHLSGNQIRNIGALSGLTNLESLRLENNQIRNVSALAGLTKLKELKLSGNRIQDTAPLHRLLKQNPDMELDIEVVGVGASPTVVTERPVQTALLVNYPNPFNPETWIPYQLSEAAEVIVSIYAVNGTLIRTLDLGHQPAGLYQGKSRAAYWDGKNALGEPVASGIYFYTLTAGDFNATRKMLIRK